MKYHNGQEVRLGDQVTVGSMGGGIVVFSIDSDEYAAKFPKADWNYLGKGVMIEFSNGALVHYEDADRNLQLARRAVSND